MVGRDGSSECWKTRLRPRGSQAQSTNHKQEVAPQPARSAPQPRPHEPPPARPRPVQSPPGRTRRTAMRRGHGEHPVAEHPGVGTRARVATDQPAPAAAPHQAVQHQSSLQLDQRHVAASGRLGAQPHAVAAGEQGTHGRTPRAKLHGSRAQRVSDPVTDLGNAGVARDVARLARHGARRSAPAAPVLASATPWPAGRRRSARRARPWGSRAG